MTTPWREYVTCQNCGHHVKTTGAFSAWLRHHEDLPSCAYAASDIDMIWHRFKTSYGREAECIMLIEVKTHGRDLTPSQRDTLHILNQLFSGRKDTPTIKRHNRAGRVPSMVWSEAKKAWVRAISYGYHVLRLSGSDPSDSDVIYWDKTRIVEDQLLGLLRFELDPATLKPLDFRRHHAIKESGLDLFGNR